MKGKKKEQKKGRKDKKKKVQRTRRAEPMRRAPPRASSQASSVPFVPCLKVVLSDIATKREELGHRGLLSRDHKIVREGTFAFIPLTKYAGLRAGEQRQLARRRIPALQKKQDYQEELKTILTKGEQQYAPHAFDVIGDICLLRIDERLASKAEKIGAAFLKSVSGIKAVYQRVGEYGGELRTQKMQYLAGRRGTETTHHENGVSLMLDIETVYFSVRSATERMRIAELVMPGEKILAMFSGCSPYECVLAKKSPATEIVGIELNKAAHQYGTVNAVLNKIENKVNLYGGDVRKIVPHLASRGVRFDRIIMPLPRTAETFLDLVPLVAKKGTVVHLYQFGPWDTDAALRRRYRATIAAQLPKSSTFRITRTVSCGQFSPRIYRICVDFVLG